MKLEFTPEEWDELKKVHTYWNEDLASRSPADHQMHEFNRRVRSVVFQALRRQPGTLNMALSTIQEMEKTKNANVPYCRAK